MFHNSRLVAHSKNYFSAYLNRSRQLGKHERPWQPETFRALARWEVQRGIVIIHFTMIFGLEHTTLINA